MNLKIASALEKDVSLLLCDMEEPINNVYSLRLYDTKLLHISMEKQWLSGLVAEIIYINEDFVDNILKTLDFSCNDTKEIFDVCKGLFLNDSFWWVVPDALRESFPNIIFMKIVFR